MLKDARKLRGQLSNEPNIVSDQFLFRINSPISPPPFKKEGNVVLPDGPMHALIYIYEVMANDSFVG
jgi:hypothetical protein